MANFCVVCGKPIAECTCKKQNPNNAGNPKPRNAGNGGNGGNSNRDHAPRNNGGYGGQQQPANNADFYSAPYAANNNGYAQNSYNNDYPQRGNNDGYNSGYNNNYGNSFANNASKTINEIRGMSSRSFNDPTYEANKKIVPDCIAASAEEVPVKQFELAELRTRVFGITIKKALGRLQVTNKRIIFRAAGKCLAGPTTIQSDVALDEIAGMEARREYVFILGDLIVALLLSLLVAFPLNLLCADLYHESEGWAIAILVLASLAFIADLILVKKHWLLKTVSAGACAGIALGIVRGSYENGLASIVIIFWIIRLIFAFVYSIHPNLVMLIKSKSTGIAIDIQRNRKIAGSVSFGTSDEHTDFQVVEFTDYTEDAIRQITAIISDIQKLGDIAIDKWKE